MDDSFSIRPAQAGDCAELARMMAELAAHHGERATISAADIRRIAFGSNAAMKFLLAFRGYPVGFAALRAWPDLRTGATLFEIDALHVRFRFRRRGVGRALIRACAMEAKTAGAAGLRLGVRPENWSARAFYMKLGFTEKSPTSVRCTLDGAALEALAEDEYWRKAA